jgi:hypothetical protein
MKRSIEWYASQHKVYRILGFKSILKSCDSGSNRALKMAGCQKRLYCENEIERALEDSLSEGSDVSSESEVVGFESESVSDSGSVIDSESEDNAEEYSESSDETAPPAPQRKKEEGWKWSVTKG